MKSNSFKHACRVSDKLTIYGFKIAKGFLSHFERYTKISKCLFWLYFKALLKNQTNKIYENGYFCDFIAVSNKLKIYTMTLSITFAVLSTSVIQVYKVI